MFPGGASPANLSSANAMLAFLSGTITSVSQQFQVKDQTSGYVAGIPNDRNYAFNNLGRPSSRTTGASKPNFSIPRRPEVGGTTAR